VEKLVEFRKINDGAPATTDETLLARGRAVLQAGAAALLALEARLGEEFLEAVRLVDLAPGRVTGSPVPIGGAVATESQFYFAGISASADGVCAISSGDAPAALMPSISAVWVVPAEASRARITASRASSVSASKKLPGPWFCCCTRFCNISNGFILPPV
jgi:hypothetical protein